MRKKILFAFILALFIPLSCLASTLEVTYIDVGQGDAALLQCEGQTMLIDAGTNSGANDLVAYLASVGISSLDYVVGTHPHEDHIGGLDAVIKNLNVSTVWMPYVQHDTKTFEDVLLAIQLKGLSVNVPAVGSTYQLGDALITVLGPISDTYDDLNNYSIILRVDHGNNSFLFMGDAEQLAENELLASGANLDADVLKVGHHGSSTSSSQVFIDAVQPQYAVISCGSDNSYGHPHAETMNTLQASGATILRTDESGSIKIISDRNSLIVDGAQEQASEAYGQDSYIGNVNSQKFHLSSCHALPAEKNRVYFDSRDAAISSGYDPCKNCSP